MQEALQSGADVPTCRTRVRAACQLGGQRRISYEGPCLNPPLPQAVRKPPHQLPFLACSLRYWEGEMPYSFWKAR